MKYIIRQFEITKSKAWKDRRVNFEVRNIKVNFGRNKDELYEDSKKKQRA